ncbi:chemotaxis protein CheD [Desulfonema ishimotonii]|uniref:Probable chemoreceptor glutamine deamidase CheD n=1 Tax=Desulfonema ishimotonii TaxID=45657 RepID=A0A401FSV2_9BACT|nr:chemotaxis protein CheD [Desulfonema ishimotonii]GBC60038.1 chemotaxis protein CheD [Desulfonema ishimotonii]
MKDKTDKPVPVNYFLEPGYIFIASEPTIISGVIGSGVSVCLFDRKKMFGGMNLYQFPYVRERQKATARYGNASTPTLIRMMLNNGSDIRHLEAQILGGAYNRKISHDNIGQENIMAARKFLHRNRIAVTSEDVGGEKGRKVIFNTSNNEVAVMKVDRIRACDWYPYENHRG